MEASSVIALVISGLALAVSAYGIVERRAAAKHATRLRLTELVRRTCPLRSSTTTGRVALRRCDDWRRARNLGEYLEAMRTTIAGMTDAEDAASAACWLAWARDHVAATDPLRGRLAMPGRPGAHPGSARAVPERWSPYGPDRW